MSDRNGFGVLGAFLLGGALGAIAGLLMAPEKGEDTREKLKDWMEDNLDESKENLEELKEEIERKLDKKKKQLGKKLNQIKEDIAEAVLEEGK
ncbi:hypothetical protein Emin_0166 [Elusimicrobium minutum Pei191]|uniref:Gas vesicle protein n=1 Tax=Elusimicrobium minutum (strain Pei191) TaxID=445932 RepID=B2KBP3_ELUMP|nr:YtxH domain-containing protein [Elusimicrobium minutum]ACC97730.1 hypothetical protein Emin_0166 [Elusimicrobium minutum Pei191]